MLLERLEKALDDAETVPPDDVAELEDIPDEDNSAPDAGDPVDLDLRNPPTSSLDTPNIGGGSHTLFSPEYTGATSNVAALRPKRMMTSLKSIALLLLLTSRPIWRSAKRVLIDRMLGSLAPLILNV